MKILNEKPNKLDFQVYESVNADPEYKMHQGIVYNDYMYKEAMKKYLKSLQNGE